MSSAIRTVPRSEQRPAAASAHVFKVFLHRLALAYRIYRERRALLSLSDSALKDLGLSRADAYREGLRSVWDLPSNRLE